MAFDWECPRGIGGAWPRRWPRSCNWSESGEHLKGRQMLSSVSDTSSLAYIRKYNVPKMQYHIEIAWIVFVPEVMRCTSEVLPTPESPRTRIRTRSWASIEGEEARREGGGEEAEGPNTFSTANVTVQSLRKPNRCWFQIWGLQI